MGDGGGGHWLVRMELRPAGWSVCLPLLISPCTIKSRSSLLAPAHPGGPGKKGHKMVVVVCGGGASAASFFQCFDTDGWVTGRTSGPQRHLCHSPSGGSLLEQVDEQNQGGPANPGYNGDDGGLMSAL